MGKPNLGLVVAAVFAAAVVVAGLGGFAESRPLVPDNKCENETLKSVVESPGFKEGGDVLVQGTCTVGPGTYKLGKVNIANGMLFFEDPVGTDTVLWASSILIENGGSLVAGCAEPPTPDKPCVKAPIGGNDRALIIQLYGGPNGESINCFTPQCGVPDAFWNTNTDHATHRPVLPSAATKISKIIADNPTLRYPGQDADPSVADDYFYAYHSLPNDSGFFGSKVLALSYGGTLQLFGKKGAAYCSGDNCDVPTGGCKAEDAQTCIPAWSTGTSWAVLNKTVAATGTQLTLDRIVDWREEDEIVVTTTDYLPGHSEQRKIAKIETINDVSVITVAPLAYHHNGEMYQLPTDKTPTQDISQLKLAFSAVDTRASVALLTRSIRIISGADTVGVNFPALPSQYAFGGHTIARQGFAALQVQGVEFYQLGQAGRLGHYPVHFHHARKTPAGTFVKDSTIHESMTRWIVLHGTHNVLLARNVGYRAIGHGFYLEDGTEIDNRLLSNIGIYARAAVMNTDGTPQRDNPRKVPGILAGQHVPGFQNFPFHSDADHPSVFWIMNGWNEFSYNTAAGAGACGACYWLVPGGNSGMSRDLKWESYASLQASPADSAFTIHRDDRTALTPLRTFVGNSCTSAMNSFVTTGNTAVCHGVVSPDRDNLPQLKPVPNPLAPVPPDPRAVTVNGRVLPFWEKISKDADAYYPLVAQGGGRFATQCTATDCSSVSRCTSGDPNCMVTVLDGYTTSFHWPEVNQSAVWLRPQWYLVKDTAITDVQGGGLTMVTGGGYTESDVIQGHWALVRKSAFIGNTQKDNPTTKVPDNPFASNGGPFNATSQLSCFFGGNYCVALDEGVAFPINNHLVNQRLFHIYDGPAYQESNAYLDITRRMIADCHPQASDSKDPDHNCAPSAWLAGKALGLPQNTAGQCYMPNAAIGWKQPNGFYYPPAFHSQNLFFKNVDIRHYVISPLFQAGSFKTDAVRARANYCTYNNTIFDNFTDVDRQTELSDNDGSLTGYVNSISVNTDSFFNAPTEAFECASDGIVSSPGGTAKTSPYEHVTTVVYPACAQNTSCEPAWSKPCSDPGCYGPPLYRQLLTTAERASCGDSTFRVPSIPLMGQATFQRSSLTVNHGDYYIDTTADEPEQRAAGATNLSVFTAGHTYYTLLLFAKPPKPSETPDRTKTRQTYRLFIGKGWDPADVKKNVYVWATRGDVRRNPIPFAPPGSVAWPSTWPDPEYDKDTGLLKVTMDMGFPEFRTDYDAVHEEHCQPATFCTWDKSTCKGKNSPDDDAVCAWAVKDVDCPKGGCYGFGFKLSSPFEHFPSIRPAPACTPVAGDPRPAPGDFPNDGYWNMGFVTAPPILAGACP